MEPIDHQAVAWLLMDVISMKQAEGLGEYNEAIRLIRATRLDLLHRAHKHHRDLAVGCEREVLGFDDGDTSPGLERGA